MLDGPRRLLYKLLGVAEAVGAKLALTARRLQLAVSTPELIKREQKRRIRGAMLANDMRTDPDEAYFQDRYWEWIAGRLRASGMDPSGQFLDAGCGPGRLTIPLAREVGKAGGTVTGVDLLPEMVEAARRYAAETDVANVAFVQSDLIEFLAGQPDGEFSAALCLEVIYVVPDLKGLIRELSRVLRPGGLLLASFRSRYFLTLLGVIEGDWDLADSVLKQGSGALPGEGGWQNWHSAPDVMQDLSDAGFSDIELHGIGVCSGISGDPMARIVQPSALSPREQSRLAAIEGLVGSSHPDIGRYILAAARRSAPERPAHG